MLRRFLRIAFSTATVALVVSQLFPPMRSNPAPDYQHRLSCCAATGRGKCHAGAKLPRLQLEPYRLALVQRGRTRFLVNCSGRSGREKPLELLRVEKPKTGERGEPARDVPGVGDQKMPPWYYLPLHPSSKLSQTEITSLCAASLTGFAD